MGDWSEGAASEAVEAAERARLLAALPPGAREAGERLLTGCEEDFSTWAFTVATLALTSTVKTAREGGEEEALSFAFDKIKQALVFFRCATLADAAKFWYGAFQDNPPGDLQELLGTLVLTHNHGLDKARQEAKRLATLLRGR